MTSKSTREENVQAVFDLKAGYTLGLADVEILKRVARMALAALDSEPYGYVHQSVYEQSGSCGLSNDHEAYRDSKTHISLYRHAQPAPVVPQKATVGEMPFLGASEGVYVRGWNDCRAAMLQENPKSAGVSNNCRSGENVQDLLAGNCRENGNSSTKHFREISETSTNRSREHFISLCNEFWNWSEMDLVCADDRGYELRMEWDGKVFKHPVTQALWRMYQAAPAGIPMIPDGYVMVPKEPTKEMIDAGWLHFMGTKNPSSKGTYKAMLAAAPQEVK